MIKKLINRLFGKPKSPVRKSNLENYLESGLITVGEESLTTGSKMAIRSSAKDRVYITIGNESVIKGNFVIENESGNISIGDRSFIGGGNFISIERIEIGNDVLISWGGTFMDNNAHSLNWEDRSKDVQDWKKGIEENKIGAYKNWKNVSSAPIIIKDKAWIGFDVIILKGVTIGVGSVVAAGSVVTKDVTDYTVVAGNPATFVKNLEK